MKLREYFWRFLGRDEFLPALTALTAAALWLPGAGSSLWRDEAITYWIIKDGWAETFERAFNFQEWSGAYFLFMKAWVAVFGASEAALRLPSAAAAAIAGYALYLLGKRLKDRETGLLAALAFCSCRTIIFCAADARPYAAAAAFAVLSTLNLAALLDMDKPKNLFAYVLFTVLAAYSHIMFAGLLAIHALYCGGRYYTERRCAGKLAAASGLIFLFLLPLAVPAQRILARAASLVFAQLPAVSALRSTAVPPALAAVVIAALLAAGGFGALAKRLKSIPASALALAAGLAFLPPLAFFFAARLSGFGIWVPRYFLYSQIGAALCVGIFLRSLETKKTRRLAAAAFAAAALLVYWRPVHSNEDWRLVAQWAAARAREFGAPVMLVSPYVESNRPAWLSDPVKTEYLSAPLSYYPVGARVIILPGKYDSSAGSYALEMIKNTAREETGAAVICAGGIDYDEWLDKRFAENRFIRAEYGRSGDISSALFIPRSRISVKSANPNRAPDQIEGLSSNRFR